jgi:hypothetical protein
MLAAWGQGRTSWTPEPDCKEAQRGQVIFNVRWSSIYVWHQKWR